MAPMVADLFRERDSKSKWTCVAAHRIRRRMYRHQLPIGLKAGSFKRMHSFMQLFNTFARWMSEQQGCRYDALACLQDNDLAEMWISSIANEDKGKTRAGSARTAMNSKRAILDFPALPVGGAITRTCTSAVRSAAKSVKQSFGIHVDRVRQMAESYGVSTIWHQRQIALMTLLGFLCLLRFAEIKSFLKLGIRLVLHDFHATAPCCTHSLGAIVRDTIPSPEDVRAVQLCLPSRKTGQHRGSWVTCSDPTTCSLLVVHLRYLQSVKHFGKFLFPSRRRHNGCWSPHPLNPMSRVSYVAFTRIALYEVCGIPWDVCLGYTGHLNRVGGNNFVRQTEGLSEDVNRQLGDWASLDSCRGYNQLPLIEQLGVTDRLHI